MKRKTKCFMCKSKGKNTEIEQSLFGGACKKEIICDCCNGTGLLDEYICKNCGYAHLEYGFQKVLGQCEKCYADIESGKYIDEFFYITKHSLYEISAVMNKLLKEGYVPVGRVSQLNEFWVSQAVLKDYKRGK